jgi:hypothetical protein
MSFIKKLWKSMQDSIDNIHGEKIINPKDFLWRIQQWAYFGKLWNPKPMNYCPYFWMGVFTTIMTFLFPFIPLAHMFYYIGLGLKFLGIKFWKYFVIVMEFLASIIMYVFTPIGRFFAYFGDKFNNWLDSIVIPIREEKVVKRKIKFSQQKINEKILYYLLEYDYFDYDSNKGEQNPQDKCENYLVSLFNNNNYDYDSYYDKRTKNFINEHLYKKLNNIDDAWGDDDLRKVRDINREDVQSWIDNNSDWYKQYKSFIKTRVKDYKREKEWERVKNKFEYTGSKGVSLDKFKEFKTELTDLEKLKRRNALVNKTIAFTKVFAKVLLIIIGAGVVGLGIWGLTFVSEKHWIETGIITSVIVGIVAVVFGIVVGIRYLIQDTRFSENCGKFFGSIWKFIKLVFLPITFIFKIFGNRMSMLLDWKKENCPQINYEGFDD